MADKFQVSLIKDEITKLLPGNPGRQIMLDEYQDVHRALGDFVAPDNAARKMVQLLKKT